jgi:hypothetical protein
LIQTASQNNFIKSLFPTSDNISKDKEFNKSHIKTASASEYFFHTVGSHLLNSSLSIAGKSS